MDNEQTPENTYQPTDEERGLVSAKEVDDLLDVVTAWNTMPFWKRITIRLTATMGRKKLLRAITALIVALALIAVVASLVSIQPPIFYITIGIAIGVLLLLALFLA